jgi:iron complex outermembrane receptor protein
VLGNVTVYYETEKWGLGSRLITATTTGPTLSLLPDDEDGNGFNATVYVDFSAFYQINEKLN